MGLCMRLAIRRFQQPRAFPFSEETPHRNKRVARSCFRSCGSLVPWRERFARMRRAPILRESFSSNFLCGRHYPPHLRNQNRPRPRSDGPISSNTDRAALCKNEPLVLKCASPITCQIADVSHLRHYFFLPEAKVGCHPAVFWLGAAAIVLIFSFLGFLDSRLPFFSPLAMPISLSLMMTQ